MTGNAVSTQANGRNTSMNIGGRSGTAAAGTATVTGAGSEIIVQGNDAQINVGREAGGNGTLNVFAGGKVSSTSLAVGISAIGTV
jgi:T5SS/PEP-CTERM-associated repeat protein